MTTPILHHYPPSLFSEKVRALFGYLGLEWQSVIIPNIMPRPHLMPLSGGYRKTPILQIGANVYCDTEIISRTLAARAGNTSLYAPGFAAERVARWADTELFRITVALNFQPKAVMTQMSQLSQADIEAFTKDRAELSKGAPIVAVDAASAEADFVALLSQLDDSLATDFLFGDTPSIADFSIYHCLWFITGNQANAHLLDPWKNVAGYLERMRAFGHGSHDELPPERALEIGKKTEPVAPQDAHVDEQVAGPIQQGQQVTVAPNDYGRIPVAGKLIHWTRDEIAIERNDEIAGQVIVHFPNVGFDVAVA